LKKCPECAAINADSDLSCGVCGTSLAGIASEEFDSQINKTGTPSPKRKLHPLRITILVAIIILMGIGSYEMLAVGNGFGFVMIILGLALIVALLGGFDSPPLRRRAGL
jgi:hypothetical protein